MALSPFVLGLADSVFSSFWAVLLVLIGIGSLVVAVVAFVQTQFWPKQAAKDKRVEFRPVAEEPPRSVVTEPRPRPTAAWLAIEFPDIRTEHPDVWEPHPVNVRVHVDRNEAPKAAGYKVRLVRHYDSEEEVVGEIEPDGDGDAGFVVDFPGLGEHDLVAELIAEDKSAGQAVRSIRIVDYRAEIVETFEDFVAWAATQYQFVDPKYTAREFVDRFIDGRPNTPVAALESIADLYEMANYSDHPVDRDTYLRMVDAFLELEEAGALDGPEEP